MTAKETAALPRYKSGKPSILPGETRRPPFASTVRTTKVIRPLYVVMGNWEWAKKAAKVGRQVLLLPKDKDPNSYRWCVVSSCHDAIVYTSIDTRIDYLTSLAAILDRRAAGVVVIGPVVNKSSVVVKWSYPQSYHEAARNKARKNNYYAILERTHAIGEKPDPSDRTYMIDSSPPKWQETIKDLLMRAFP